VVIMVNGKYLRDYIGYGGPGKSRNQLPMKKYEEALRLKEKYSLVEMGHMLGLTKNGAATRVYAARRFLLKRTVCRKICSTMVLRCKDDPSKCPLVRVWIRGHPKEWREINSNGEHQKPKER